MACQLVGTKPLSEPMLGYCYIVIGPLRTSFSEILIQMHTFSFKKSHFKMLSGKWWPFCLGLNVLKKPQDVIIQLCKIRAQKGTNKQIRDIFQYEDNILRVHKIFKLKIRKRGKTAFILKWSSRFPVLILKKRATNWVASLKRKCCISGRTNKPQFIHQLF